MRLQGVVAIIFLRLIVPAILDPRKYFVIHGVDQFALFASVYLYSRASPITKGTPNPLVSRSLQQIAKIIQALANMCTPTAKVIAHLIFTADLKCQLLRPCDISRLYTQKTTNGPSLNS